MKRFLIVLVLIAVGIAGLGFYRGWFRVESDTASDKANLTLSADKGKIEQDKNKAVDRIQGLGHQVKDEAGATAQKAKDQAAGAPRSR